MASEKDIRTKIGSVKSTQKITNAMQMVAASKMRKAQDRMEASKPYAQRIREAVAHIAAATPEYRHRYMVERDVKRVGFIVVSSDRGLCGGLNINVFKKVVAAGGEWSAKDIESDYCLIGKKAVSFFSSVGGNVTASTSGLGDEPSLNDMVGGIKVMLDAFDEGKIDRLYLVSNEFVNTMTQDPQLVQLLPLQPEVTEESNKGQWDYIYEPDAQELLDTLLTRYVESQIYQAVVENVACEMAARMVAMKAATDNAGDIIDGLELTYNRIRQAAITQEISEIVGGAAAV